MWFLVGVSLSEVGLAEFRKPQVRFLSRESNSLNFKAAALHRPLRFESQVGHGERSWRIPYLLELLVRGSAWSPSLVLRLCTIPLPHS